MPKTRQRLAAALQILLPDVDFLKSLYAYDELMSEKRMEGLCYAYEMKIKLLDAFQHGADLKKMAFQSQTTPVEMLL